MNLLPPRPVSLLLLLLMVSNCPLLHPPVEDDQAGADRFIITRVYPIILCRQQTRRAPAAGHASLPVPAGGHMHMATETAVQRLMKRTSAHGRVLGPQLAFLLLFGARVGKSRLGRSCGLRGGALDNAHSSKKVPESMPLRDT
jgi:hypothetical protein